MKTGTVVKVSGPLVVAEGMRDANMFDVVRVSEKHLIGEIIEMHGDRASIQVYEETAGLGPGEQVVSTGMPMSVELGPGLISTIYDGIQRPLESLYRVSGTNIQRGVEVPSLDREKKWDFVPHKAVGDKARSRVPYNGALWSKRNDKGNKRGQLHDRGDRCRCYRRKRKRCSPYNDAEMAGKKGKTI